MIVTIIGLGVIGGSYGLALKDKDIDVYGIDIDYKTLKKAKDMGIIKNGFMYNSLESKDVVSKSDVLIISIYPEQIREFVDFYKSYFSEELIITDVTGVKEKLISELELILPNHVDFIFAHPMAGREKRGIDYASPNVFEKANFIITPTEKNKEKNIRIIEDLARKMGFSNINKVSPKDHDCIISFTSQLPHVLAVSLINSDDLAFDTGSFIGDSYRELTRIANINEDLWSELFLGNKENLLTRIENFEKELLKIKECLLNNDDEILKEIFKEATRRRERL
ncbi:MAG: prephenate dehydrogenase [Clostridium perfringens]|nr:prephenate dehydrogenase [Clostridium perfringens]